MRNVSVFFRPDSLFLATCSRGKSGTGLEYMLSINGNLSEEQLAKLGWGGAGEAGRQPVVRGRASGPHARTAGYTPNL